MSSIWSSVHRTQRRQNKAVESNADFRGEAVGDSLRAYTLLLIQGFDVRSRRPKKHQTGGFFGTSSATSVHCYSKLPKLACPPRQIAQNDGILEASKCLSSIT